MQGTLCLTPPQTNPHLALESSAIGAAYKGSRNPARHGGRIQGFRTGSTPLEGSCGSGRSPGKWRQAPTGVFRKLDHSEANTVLPQTAAHPRFPVPQTCFRTLFLGTVWRFGSSSHILCVPAHTGPHACHQPFPQDWSPGFHYLGGGMRMLGTPKEHG